MRWFPFFILAYFTLGIWLGTGGYLALDGAAPNLVLIAAVFVCINAPRDSALLAVFLLGFLQDLLSAQPLGLHAVSYGLAGLLVVGSRQLTYSDHPLTHVFVTLGGGLVVVLVMWIHGLIRHAEGPMPAGSDTPLPPVRLGLGILLLGALYTAAISPFILWFLNRFRPFFGFRTGRPRYGYG